MTATAPRPQPAIIVLSGDHCDVLRAQLGRYAAEYDVRVEADLAAARSAVDDVLGTGAQVALFVLDSTPAERTADEVLRDAARAVPTARRVVVAPFDRFLADSDAMRRAWRPGSSTRSSCCRAGCATRSSTARSSTCSTTGVPAWPPPRWRRSGS